MVDVWFPYGDTEVCLRVPTRNFLGALKPKEKREAEDPEREIETALESPIGTKRLAEIAKPGEKVSIVIKDSVDASVNHLMILMLQKELKSAGVREEDVRVILAHDPLCASRKLEQLFSFFGDDARKRVVVHNSEDKRHVYIGETSFGTKVYVNKAFAEADVKVLTGVIDPHPYAGYSGGRDGVLPGVSSIETIDHNHSFVIHPKAKTGLLNGNPLHQDMVEAAQLVGVDFTLNLVANKSGVAKAFSGDLNSAFSEGVRYLENVSVPIERRADIVVISPGGAPLDINLYESCKSLNNVLEAVKRGGVIVLSAECPEGYGDNSFYEWMIKFKDLKSMEKNLKRHFIAGGYIAYCLMRTLQKANVILVSTLPDYYAFEVFKLKTARTVNEALRYAFEIASKNAKVLAVLNGRSTIPFVA